MACVLSLDKPARFVCCSVVHVFPTTPDVGKKVQMSLVDYCATFVCRIFNADVVLIRGNLDECPRKDSPNGPRGRGQRSPW